MFPPKLIKAFSKFSSSFIFLTDNNKNEASHLPYLSYTHFQLTLPLFPIIIFPINKF